MSRSERNDKPWKPRKCKVLNIDGQPGVYWQNDQPMPEDWEPPVVKIEQ